MEKGIVFAAPLPPAVLSRRFVALSARSLLYGAQLDRFLGLFDRPGEIARRLGGARVGVGLRGMHEKSGLQIVVGITLLHIRKGFPVVFVAVEIDIVAGDEFGILSGGGRVFLKATPGRKNHQDQTDNVYGKAQSHRLMRDERNDLTNEAIM